MKTEDLPKSVSYREAGFIDHFVRRGRRLEAFQEVYRVLHPDREHSKSYDAMVKQRISTLPPGSKRDPTPIPLITKEDPETGESVIYVRVEEYTIPLV